MYVQSGYIIVITPYIYTHTPTQVHNGVVIRMVGGLLNEFVNSQIKFMFQIQRSIHVLYRNIKHKVVQSLNKKE